MNHRHLLPEELDQLLDQEEGFGVAPLRAHLSDCAQCSSALFELQRVAAQLDSLPHFAPSSAFSARVMSQVQVFEPWHVALRDRIRSIAPSSRAGRVAVGASGVGVAVALSAAGVWLAPRADAVIFVTTLFAQRARDAIVSTTGSLLGTLVGDSALSNLRAGGAVGFALTAAAGLVAVAGVAYGLKAVATAGRRRRA